MDDPTARPRVYSATAPPSDPPAMPDSTPKIYRGRTMAEALAEVKKNLGKDAVILKTRAFKYGGIMGVGGKPMVEITATLDHSPALLQPNPQPSIPSPTQSPTQIPTQISTPTYSLKPRPVSHEHLAPVIVTRPVTSRATAPVASRPHSLLTTFTPQAQPLSGAQALANRVAFRPTDSSTRLILEDEITSIKRLVSQVLQTTRHGASRIANRPPPASSAVLTLGPMSEPLFANYMRLIETGVGSDIAEELASRVRDELSEPELADSSIVRETLLRHITSEIQTTPPQLTGRTLDGRPTTIALIGPTGVGKTTTIAKLAAHAKLKQGLRVGLITCDTYRIAAVEQLRTYAGILAIPLRVVLAPQDMPAACDAFNDCDLILIDTAGRSQNDTTRLHELSAYLAAARPHETHLTLSLTVSEPVMLSTADRFATLNPDRVILSKADEAVHFGPVLNLARRTGLAISALTMGQEVPDHFQHADPEHLARIVLDGEWSEARSVLQ